MKATLKLERKRSLRPSGQVTLLTRKAAKRSLDQPDRDPRMYLVR